MVSTEIPSARIGSDQHNIQDTADVSRGQGRLDWTPTTPKGGRNPPTSANGQSPHQCHDETSLRKTYEKRNRRERRVKTSTRGDHSNDDNRELPRSEISHIKYAQNLGDLLHCYFNRNPGKRQNLMEITHTIMNMVLMKYFLVRISCKFHEFVWNLAFSMDISSKIARLDLRILHGSKFHA